MYQTSCAGCGLDVNDLPDELGDRALLRDQFFVFNDGGDLYCNGCAVGGVFL